MLLTYMGSFYKDHTDKSLADLNVNYHKIKNLTHKLNDRSIRHISILIETRCALQYNLNNNSQGRVWVKRHTTPLTHSNFLSFAC